MVKSLTWKLTLRLVEREDWVLEEGYIWVVVVVVCGRDDGD